MQQPLEKHSPLRWVVGAPLDLLGVVARRLWSHLSMMLALAIGFTIAIALVVAIPVYAEAVGYRVLKTELSRREDGSRRTPFTFMYRYIVSSHKQITWNDYTKLDDYMRQRAPRQLGLPVLQHARYVSSDKLQVLPPDGAGTPLLWMQFAFAEGIEPHINFVDGRMPQANQSGPIEVAITEDLAAKSGFQVGEEYLLLGPKSDPSGASQRVRIVGVWHAKDPLDGYWFYGPSGFDDTLLIPEANFTNRIIATNPKSIYVALWYFVTDGSAIRSANVPEIGGRIQRSQVDADAILPGTRLDDSPLDALVLHQQQVRRLTVTLTMFSIPLFALIAYFVVLVAGLVVQRQSNEIAVLRSRGASQGQVVAVYLLEALLLGVATLILGLVLGQLAAQAMVWTRSFLVLEPGEATPISLTNEAWQRAWQMLGLMMLASLLPAIGAARFTVVSFKAERARATRPPFWQRAYLDLLLLVPVGYGYYMLRNEGPGAFVPKDATVDPFANPLLLLAPTLAIFALALVAVRLFPLLMRFIGWAIAWLPGIAALTAFRSMARAPKLYTRPLLLMILTLSLATFTASMAATLDQQLLDQSAYETGGILQINDYGQSTEPIGGFGAPGTSDPNKTPKDDKVEDARYLFLPPSDYLAIPGVQAVARVSRSTVDLNASGKHAEAQFLGIDRADIPAVVTWRGDYANETLGALLNRLADDPSAVIVSSDLAAMGVRVGDKISLSMRDLGEARQVPFTVVGFTKLFPTAFPEDGPFVLGNIEYAFEQQGGQYPYEVWMRLAPDASHDSVMDEITKLGLRTTELGYAPQLVTDEQQRPERQGVFGLLSVGFVAAAVLTAIGFLFYALIMFQRRFVELGALRAIGLGAGQLGALLAWEQGMLIVCGLLGGTLIGVGVSTAFIPFLQVRGGKHPLTPPFVVEIAWGQIALIYIVFAGVLAVVTLLTMILLRRMRLFEAIKMGEAV